MAISESAAGPSLPARSMTMPAMAGRPAASNTSPDTVVTRVATSAMSATASAPAATSIGWASLATGVDG